LALRYDLRAAFDAHDAGQCLRSSASALGRLNAGTPPAGGTASAAAGGAAASKADKERQRKERQKQRKVAEAEAALQAALAALDHNAGIR